MNLIVDGIIFSLQKYGGISTYFDELIKYSNKLEAKCTLLVDSNSTRVYNSDNSNFDICMQQSRIFERYRACNVSKVDGIFHSSYYRTPSNRKLPSVVTVHDFVYERYRAGLPKFVHSTQKKFAIQKAQAIICVSDSTKSDLLYYYGDLPGKSIYVVHNGVSDKFHPIDAKLVENNSYILYVGQRGGYKNFEYVLSTMKLLPNLKLYCVGGGDFNQNDFAHCSSDVIKRVKHFGYVTDEQLNQFYNNALCLVYPSSYEGFGIPVIEAMKAGCPVICVDCKAVIEVGQEALSVVDINDTHSLASEIFNLSTARRFEKIQKGIEISKKYSWDKTHHHTFEIYKTLI